MSQSSHFTIGAKDGFLEFVMPSGSTSDHRAGNIQLQEIIHACGQAQVKKALVIAPDIDVKFDSAGLFELGKGIAGARIQIAIHAPNHNAPPGATEFMEAVVANRLGSLRFFDDKQAALTWLGILG